jgi:hypothetical protein
MNIKTKALMALATLAASIGLAATANATAVQASASITGVNGTLLNLSSSNEYDVIAQTRQQESTQYGTVLPYVSLNDPDGFSFAGVDNTFDPYPGVLAGAHDLGFGASSVVWSVSYTATDTGLATLDLEYLLGLDVFRTNPADTALGSASINIKRSGVQEAGSQVLSFFSTTSGIATDFSEHHDFDHLLYSFNVAAGETGTFLITLGSQGMTTPVPLPAGIWLLGSGLVGLGARLRRKRAA